MILTARITAFPTHSKLGRKGMAVKKSRVKHTDSSRKQTRNITENTDENVKLLGQAKSPEYAFLTLGGTTALQRT